MSEFQINAKIDRALPYSKVDRYVELDVLRCFAVFLVLLNHMWAPDDSVPVFLQNFAEVMRRGAWIGVDLFFVLSGFLISGLLFREYVQHGRISFKRFFIRRGLKIYPPLYFLVLITLILKAATEEVDWWKIFCDLAFIQNYGSVYWGHTWTLAVEEHFYLLLPWLLILLLHFARNKVAPFEVLPKLFIGVAIALLGLRIFLAWKFPHQREEHDEFLKRHFFPTHLRIDSLFFGVLLSFYHHFHPVQLRAWVSRWAWILMPLSVVLVLPPFFLPLEHSPFIYTVGFALLYLGFGSLLILVMTLGLPRGPFLDRFFRSCGNIGFYSYSIYLWHFPLVTTVVVVLRKRFNIPWMLEVPFYIILSVACGIIVAKLIEIPALNLRDRFFPSRSKPMPSPLTLDMPGAALIRKRP